ncbi:MAG: DUF1028 domain-containing protein [Candidatus Heimdallarchaeota archaeon]|nr:DUF1028 domain-containing protein [Candidatus Heimdallarchaeota archaeon]
MTFSIVAYDPVSGEIGIGVQSKAFGVGSLVPWVKAGIGAVATQSLVNVKLGPIGLELLEDGRSAEQVMEYFQEIDSGIERRQLGILSTKHGAYSFTGKECISWAGGYVGENFCCQGNILTGSQVISDMAKAFENTDGDIATRIMTALTKAQNAGGDARGKQSAALIVEQSGRGRAGYGDRKIDLRVEDHENPIEELNRLLEINRLGEYAYTAYTMENKNEAINYLKSKIDGRMDRTLDETWIALANLYFSNNQKEDAKEAIETALIINPGMKNILTFYPKLGFGFSDEFISELAD